MEQTLNIYSDRSVGYEYEKERLRTWKTSDKNKELILRYHAHLFATGSRYMRVTKLSTQLRKITLILPKDLDKLTRADIVLLVGRINEGHTTLIKPLKQGALIERREWRDVTKADYRRGLKQFYKWFKQEDPRLVQPDIEDVTKAEYKRAKQDFQEAKAFYDYLEREVKIKFETKKIRFDDILTDADITKVLDEGCRGYSLSIRDRAFLSLLHETGARAGEILTMRVKSLQKQDKFAKITLEGKTGVRNIIIVQSVPYLHKWLEVHPHRENPTSPLWIGMSSRYPDQPICHRGAQNIIDRAFKRVNLQKKRNLHFFRHSRATLLSQHLTEVQLCKYMGWEIGSRQVRTYCHASDKQTDESILRIHGLSSQEQTIPEGSPKDCPICQEVNQGINKYCSRCGAALTLKVAMDHEDQVKNATEVLMGAFLEIAKDPARMAEFMSFRESLLKKTCSKG